MLDSLGVQVDSEDRTAFAEQVDQVTPVAASRLENTHACAEIAAQDLVEDVDVDLAELFLKVQLSTFHVQVKAIVLVLNPGVWAEHDGQSQAEGFNLWSDSCEPRRISHAAVR